MYSQPTPDPVTHQFNNELQYACAAAWLTTVLALCSAVACCKVAVESCTGAVEPGAPMMLMAIAVAPGRVARALALVICIGCIVVADDLSCLIDAVVCGMAEMGGWL